MQTHIKLAYKRFIASKIHNSIFNKTELGELKHVKLASFEVAKSAYSNIVQKA